MPDNLHIRPGWQKIAARLQHEARKTQGYGILTMRGIFIDANGNPIMWTEPKLMRLEPKGICDPSVILGLLTEGLDE